MGDDSVAVHVLADIESQRDVVRSARAGAGLCRAGDLTLVTHRAAMPYTNDSTGDDYVWRT